MPYKNRAEKRRYAKQYYVAHADAIRAAKRKYDRSPKGIAAYKRAYTKHVVIVSKLKDVPCLDCGGRFPRECMDFDHTRGKKKFTIAYGVYRSEKALMAEVAKCDIVCSNCHRIRTSKRRNHVRNIND